MLRNVIDRIKTIHPSAKVSTTDDATEVSFGAEKVVLKIAGDKVGVGSSPETLQLFSRREFENEVMDQVHELWKKHEATLPKKPSSSGGGSYSGGGGGDDDVDAIGHFIDHDPDGDDD